MFHVKLVSRNEGAGRGVDTRLFVLLPRSARSRASPVAAGYDVEHILAGMHMGGGEARD